MNIALLQSLLGWSLLINAVILAFAAISLFAFQARLLQLHSKLLGIDIEQLKIEYLRFLGNYKLLVAMFNLVPWLALQLI